MSGRLIGIACLIALLSPWPTLAQSDGGQKDERGIFNDRFRIGFGGYRSDFQSQASVNSSTVGLGTTIRFEDTFNVPNWNEYVNLWGYYRFNDKHRIDYGFYTVDRDGGAATKEDIQFGDHFIPAGTSVTSDFEFTSLNLQYAYAIFHNDRIESGVTAGLTFTSTDFRLVTSGLPTDIDVTEDVTLPLPMVGFYAAHALKPRLFFKYRGTFFLLEYDKYSGNVVDLRASLEWFPWDYFGIGGGIASYRLDVEVEDNDGFDGTVDIEYRGYNLYLTFAF